MNHPTEPNADLRAFASTMWQMFVALTAQGFSERQALVVIGQIQILAASVSENSDE